MENTIQKIIAYFEENEEIFNDCMEELDSYNGYMGDGRYYYMEDLNYLFHGSDPIEILQRAYFGRDDETWTTDAYGNKTYGAFNPNREYFYFNGYGNLVSANYKDYSAHLDSYAIESMSENRQYIDTIESDEELSALFDILELKEQIEALEGDLTEAGNLPKDDKILEEIEELEKQIEEKEKELSEND